MFLTTPGVVFCGSVAVAIKSSGWIDPTPNIVRNLGYQNVLAE